MFPERCQVVEMAFGVHLGVGTASGRSSKGETFAIQKQKFIENYIKLSKNLKNTDSKTNFEFNIIF